MYMSLALQKPIVLWIKISSRIIYTCIIHTCTNHVNNKATVSD